MCERCDKKMVAKQWAVWSGIILTLTLFVLSQVFIYGKVIGNVETHIKNDPTYRELTEGFVSKDSFKDVQDRIKTVEEMVLYLYKKEGGK